MYRCEWLQVDGFDLTCHWYAFWKYFPKESTRLYVLVCPLTIYPDSLSVLVSTRHHDTSNCQTVISVSSKVMAVIQHLADDLLDKMSHVLNFSAVDSHYVRDNNRKLHGLLLLSAFPIRGRHSGFSFSSFSYQLYPPPSLQPQPCPLSPHP